MVKTVPPSLLQVIILILLKLSIMVRVVLDKLSSQSEQTASPCQIKQALTNTNTREIYQFITQAPVEEISFILQSAQLNDALSKEGLNNTYGLHIGQTLQRQQQRGLLAKRSAF